MPIEKLKDFNKYVFYLLEKKMPTEAVSMTMKSLSRLGVNTVVCLKIDTRLSWSWLVENTLAMYILTT